MSIIIAMIFSVFSTWGSYYYSDKIVLSLNKARPATKEEYQKLVNILEIYFKPFYICNVKRMCIFTFDKKNSFRI